MTDSRVTLVAKLKAKAGLEEEVKKTLLTLIAPTRLEPGCINYDLHQATEDKSLFLFYKNWINQGALDEHMAKPYLKEFMGRADEILAEPIDVTLWSMISNR